MTVQRIDQVNKVNEFFSSNVNYWRDVYVQDEPYNAYAYPYQMRQANAIKLIKKHLPLGAKVLDIGCGGGMLVFNLAKEGYSLWGVDLVPQMIDNARQIIAQEPDLAAKVNFAVGSIGQLSFPTAHFDAVTSLGVLEYMDDPLLALREISRILKPNGIAVLSVPNSSSPFRTIGKLATRTLAQLRDVTWLRSFKYRFILKQAELEDAVKVSGQYRHLQFSAQQIKDLLQKANLIPVEDVYQIYGLRISDLWVPLPFELVRRLETLNQWDVTRWMGCDYIIVAQKQ